MKSNHMLFFFFPPCYPIDNVECCVDDADARDIGLIHAPY